MCGHYYCCYCGNIFRQSIGARASIALRRSWRRLQIMRTDETAGSYLGSDATIKVVVDPERRDEVANANAARLDLRRGDGGDRRRRRRRRRR